MLLWWHLNQQNLTLIHHKHKRLQYIKTHEDKIQYWSRQGKSTDPKLPYSGPIHNVETWIVLQEKPCLKIVEEESVEFSPKRTKLLRDSWVFICVCVCNLYNPYTKTQCLGCGLIRSVSVYQFTQIAKNHVQHTGGYQPQTKPTH